MPKYLFKLIPIIIIALASWFGYQYISAPAEDRAGKSDKATKSRSSGKSKKTGNLSRKLIGQQTTAEILVSCDYEVELFTQGTVKTDVSTVLNPSVSGKIINISHKFQNGAFFEKGDILIELDPTDFKGEIINAEANVARAQAALIQEQATAAQALRNWQDIGFDEEPNDLVLRKPQLKEAEANLAAQEASLSGAKLNLARTAIKAPFNGRVRDRLVGPGQSVNSGTNLGTIYATDSAEIRLPLSSIQLEKISLDEQGDQGIPIILTDAINSNNDTAWKATITRVEGELDESSRELFVIAKINDPFGIHSDHPPLRINQPVKAKIIGNTLKNAVIIDRKYIYGANEIILIENDLIKRTNINITWTTQDFVITQDSELAGKMIATSRLSFATDGTSVEIIYSNNESTEPTKAQKVHSDKHPPHKRSSKL